jgi:hypothetical protein
MAKISILNWTVEASPEDTASIHAARSSGGADACSCLYCRNFAAARSDALPHEFIQILASLGIDPTKDSEIYETHEQSPGVHSYGGWYHALGEVISGSSEYAQLTEEFSIRITDHRDLLPGGFANHPVVQIDFDGPVPWVLNEPYEPPDIGLPNNSLERTQPQRGFKSVIDWLRRSARSR